MAPEVELVSVQLSCNHFLDFRRSHVPPKTDAEIWCRPCSKMRRVIAVTTQYRIKCNHCRYSRSFGRDLEAAKRAASTHVTRKATHKVSLKDGARIVQVYTIHSGGIMADMLASIRPTHQSMLRNMEDRLYSQCQDSPPKP